ncbi:MAG: tungsten ABC transporter substrate-binding protein [Candidatus Omnitrophica bacterium]|nr:tungsten ABC transporter substrate-binding protein [Candidatus Omnitrophota bacterium]
MKHLKLLLILLLIQVLGLPCFAKDTLKLATTTSTYETGLLDYIFPSFEEKHDVEIHIISVGTGKAIKLGENADVDIILVHARGAEDRFLNEGYGINRRDVMYNDFLILGPASDPARISKISDTAKALKRIYKTKSTFVSRGDDSGTHKKEKLLWKKASLKPHGKWYLEAGQGMAATLRMADEKNAYCMVDRATYLSNESKIRLKLLLKGDQILFNPYGVIAVNPYKHSHVNYEMAMNLIAWLTSPKCQEMIATYKKNGNLLYHPNAANPIIVK